MSTSIRISYEHPEELETILQKLSPIVKTAKLQPPKGKYKRAYLHMKPIVKESEATVK